jgi:hypothetical protein
VEVEITPFWKSFEWLANEISNTTQPMSQAFDFDSMCNKSIRFKMHPRDFFRDTHPVELPDPEVDLERFLVLFLDDYSRDDRIAQLDDLSKLLYGELPSMEAEDEIKTRFAFTGHDEIAQEIQRLEANLTMEAYVNYYRWVRTGRLEVLFQ